MIPLNSILAEQNPYAGLPMIVALICAAVLALAFVVGFAKGFRRVGWGGLAWLTTCILFVLADGMFRAALMVPFQNMGFTPEIASFWAAIIVAIVCIVIVLVLHGVLSVFLRPKLLYINEADEDDNDLAEFGLEYEDDYLDYDYDYRYAPEDKTVFRSGYTNPSVGNRIFGGIANAVKWGMILFIALSFAVFAVAATHLAEQPIGIIMSVPIVQTLYVFAARFALEFLSIGLVIVFGIKGYSKGLLASFRSLFVIGGGIAAAVLSFLLPFTQFSVSNGFIGNLVGRCVNLFGGAENMMGYFIGRIVAGCCLLAFFIILLVIINVVLKKCCNMIQKGPIRVIDGAFACVIYLIIGVALAIGIWCILFTLDYCGIIYTTEIFATEASLARGLFQFAETMIKPFLSMFIVA